MTTVTLEIDGISLQAEAGEMLIAVADRAGITIPRFCYHKKLSVAANCRMCLVEVERAPKPLPACATPVTAGMKVLTHSPLAREAQKGTLEFLLINHPLDCPVCDQGGECELQDLAMGYGRDVSRFTEGKRVVVDKDLGPLIATDMTRCIHCTRCVRFGDEIAGVRELGATGRGDHTLIGTYIAKSVDSELSGNVIDLCPVGALTAKPSRYTVRPWELVQRATIAGHDAVGSHLYAHIRRSQVMRVVPKEAEEINETWLADRDRFAYEGLYHAERLTQPLLKIRDQWQAATWEAALTTTSAALQGIKAHYGAEQVGILLSPSATVEELFLAQQLFRDWGCPNIDHRLAQTDFRGSLLPAAQEPAYYWLGQSLADLERVEAALLIGTVLNRDLPLVAHRLRKAARRGAKIMCINPADYRMAIPLTQVLTGAAEMVLQLSGVVKAVLQQRGLAIPPAWVNLLEPLDISAAQQAVAAALLQTERATILLGPLAVLHPQYALLQQLAQLLATGSAARLGYLPAHSNSVGAWQVGALPHRGVAGQPVTAIGQTAAAMLQTPLKAYVILALEPEHDSIYAQTALAALQGAEQVIVLTAYKTPVMESYATVLLPIATYFETAGTFVNLEARWQSFNGVCQPPGEARPGWKVLRVLANHFGLPGYQYQTIEAVRMAYTPACHSLDSINQVNLTLADMADIATPANPSATDWADQIYWGEQRAYALDPLVRRATALQQTALAQAARRRG